MSSPLPAHRCAIGLGCVTFGREIDPVASFAMMDYAMVRGIALFDTASAYSNGGSERIVGQWLGTRQPDQPRPEIATKILPPYTAEMIRRSVADSLSRLAVSQLDLLFLHRWDESLLKAEAHEALQDLVQRGSVRALAISNISDTQLACTLEPQAGAGAARFSWVQNIHNFAVRGFDAALRQRCQAAGIKMMGYSPLGAGFLTGKHRDGVAPGSRFEVIPGHQAVYFTPQSRQRFARLEEAARRTGRSQVELALAWAVHQPWIDLVLVGGRNSDQIQQILAARDGDARTVLGQLGED